MTEQRNKLLMHVRTGMNLEDNVLRESGEARHKRIHTIRFHLYEFQEQANRQS